jgi:CRISPR-associated endonuclease/helicase Cas3
VLHVLCPPWNDDPAEDWFKRSFPKAASVYANRAQLWLTMQALRWGHFAMPDDARRLIEGVFGDDTCPPPGLLANALASEGKGWADLSQAQLNTIRLDRGYERGGIDWWSDARTPTRLGDATSTVMLARWDGQQLRPWVDRPHGWAYSSLRMAERAIAAEASGSDAALDDAIRALRLEHPALFRWSVLLPLRQTPDGWLGEALAPGDWRRAWIYDARRGLRALPVPIAGSSATTDRPEDPEA